MTLENNLNIVKARRGYWFFKSNSLRVSVLVYNGAYSGVFKSLLMALFQINMKVKQNSINLIFAVTSEQIEVYDRLKTHIEGASSGTLTSNSSNVVDLVKEQYDVSISR